MFFHWRGLFICVYVIIGEAKEVGFMVWFWVVGPWDLGRYSTCLFYSISICSQQFLPLFFMKSF